jgi:hypothetical protein
LHVTAGGEAIGEAIGRLDGDVDGKGASELDGDVDDAAWDGWLWQPAVRIATAKSETRSFTARTHEVNASTRGAVTREG